MGERIDGKDIAKRMRAEVAAGVKALGGAAPKLVAVAVGHDESSAAYTRSQAKSAAKVGIDYELDELPEDTDQHGLRRRIAELAEDEAVTGIILQTPLPTRIDMGAARDMIPSGKDVEAIGATATGHLVQNRYQTAPCTALAAISCLKAAVGDDLSGLDVVVIGRSDIVGKPLALLLLHENATPTVCHTRTKDLAARARQADVVIAAAGRAGLVTGEMIGDGAVVIDVGTNSYQDEEGKWRLKGDVDFESAEPRAKAITPVPGGVGPVTVATLLSNVLILAKAQRS